MTSIEDMLAQIAELGWTSPIFDTDVFSMSGRGVDFESASSYRARSSDTEGLQFHAQGRSLRQCLERLCDSIRRYEECGTAEIDGRQRGGDGK